jgi:hypothetical protein
MAAASQELLPAGSARSGESTDGSHPWRGLVSEAVGQLSSGACCLVRPVKFFQQGGFGQYRCGSDLVRVGPVSFLGGFSTFAQRLDGGLADRDKRPQVVDKGQWTAGCEAGEDQVDVRFSLTARSSGSVVSAKLEVSSARIRCACSLRRRRVFAAE